MCVRGDRGWNTVYMFMLGYVAFSVYCHAAGEPKYKIRLIGVLNIALDLAAAALRIERRVGKS